MVRDLLIGLPVALAAAAATWSVVDLRATFVLQVAGLYTGVAALIVTFHPPVLPGPGLGAANRVTLGRAVLTLPLAALVLHAESLGAGSLGAASAGTESAGTVARWWIVGVGTTVMVLDGFDGWIARRTGTRTSFGARFDMETDAFLMLVLSTLAWVTGRAGAWVLLIGAMRYLFVAAGWIVPALRAPLFPSLRRKVVCVVQGVGLLVCLGPVVPAPLATRAAALALASLVWSFGLDTVWLLRRDRSADERASKSTAGPT